MVMIMMVVVVVVIEGMKEHDSTSQQWGIYRVREAVVVKRWGGGKERKKINK